MPLELLTIFAKGFILDVWLGSWQASHILKKDKSCQKPVKELFLETSQLRLKNSFKEMSEKNSTEKWFSSQLFSAIFVRNSEAATRGVLKKTSKFLRTPLLKNIYEQLFL